MKTKNNIVKDGNNKAYLITELTNNPRINGFNLSFRTYSLENESGGFLTSIIVSNAGIELANMFCGLKFEIYEAAKMVDAKINGFKTNNIVSDKFTFRNIF